MNKKASLFNTIIGVFILFCIFSFQNTYAKYEFEPNVTISDDGKTKPKMFDVVEVQIFNNDSIGIAIDNDYNDIEITGIKVGSEIKKLIPNNEIFGIESILRAAINKPIKFGFNQYCEIGKVRLLPFQENLMEDSESSSSIEIDFTYYDKGVLKKDSRIFNLRKNRSGLWVVVGLGATLITPSIIYDYYARSSNDDIGVADNPPSSSSNRSYINFSRITTSRSSSSSFSRSSSRVGECIANVTYMGAAKLKIESFHDITIDEVREIANFIREATRSMTVSLAHNRMSAEGLIEIAYAIRNTIHPMVIDLSNNYIGEKGEIVITAIAEAIRDAQQPMHINLADNGINSAGAVAIANIIRGTQHPVDINLYFNRIDNEGAVAIAGAIIYAQQPMHINLDHNGINSAGVVAIAEAIRYTQQPMHINLADNGINSAGVKAIAEAIRYTQQPMHINLAHNEISSAGLEAIAEAIGNATQPMTINLYGVSNSIAATALAFANAIRNAQQPMDIDLGKTNLSPEGVIALASAIRDARQRMTIRLRGHGIYNREMGLGAIADAIEHARQPMNIDLGENAIGEEGLRIIMSGIINAQHPMTINLTASSRFMYIPEHTIGNDGAIIIADAIQRARQPMTIILNDTRIGERGEEAIARSIANRPFFSTRVKVSGLSNRYDHLVSKYRKVVIDKLRTKVRSLEETTKLPPELVQCILGYDDIIMSGDTSCERFEVTSFVRSELAPSSVPSDRPSISAFADSQAVAKAKVDAKKNE